MKKKQWCPQTGLEWFICCLIPVALAGSVLFMAAIGKWTFNILVGGK